MQVVWPPPLTLGRLLALLVFLAAVLSLVVTISLDHFLTWLLIALSLAFLIG